MNGGEILSKAALTAFLRVEGWAVSGGDAFRDLGLGRLVVVSPFAKRFTTDPLHLSINEGVVWPRLCQHLQAIDPDRTPPWRLARVLHVPLPPPVLADVPFPLTEPVLRALLDKATTALRPFDVQAGLEGMCVEKSVPHGSFPLYHLAALALHHHTDRLQDYLDRTDAGNPPPVMLPYLTRDHLRRALDLAGGRLLPPPFRSPLGKV